jgi:hypothetical protein
MSFDSNQNRTYVASEAIGINIRVKLTATAGEVAIAGAGEDYIGVTEYPAAAGAPVPVRHKNSSGTCYFVAAGAFAYGAQVYGVAAGKVDDVASTNVLVGTALEAASGAGHRVEILNALHGPLASASQAAVVAASINGTAAAAIPGALTSTNGVAAAAAADLAALAAEAEKIGDDVRAVHAAVLLAQAENEKIGDDARAAVVLVNAIRSALIAKGFITGAA